MADFDFRCRHCNQPIERASYWSGPGWKHVSSNFDGYLYCRMTEAAPPEES